MDDDLCIVCGCDPEGVCGMTGFFGEHCPINPFAVPLPPRRPANDCPGLVTAGDLADDA